MHFMITRHGGPRAHCRQTSCSSAQGSSQRMAPRGYCRLLRQKLPHCHAVSMPPRTVAPRHTFLQSQQRAHQFKRAAYADMQPGTGITGGSATNWETEIEELQKLISLLPVSVRSAVEDHPEMTDILEVVMDLGRLPLARFPSGDVKLSQTPITNEDLDYAIAQVGDFGGDNRAGIDRTLHRISCIRNRRGTVVGLTCRVGRAIWGSAEMVLDLVNSGASILFLGRPGVGKTTAIREVSRSLSDVLQKRVVIVDTSNEIGGDGDIPHDGIGRARRMQVQHPDMQHKVMVEAVENHMPEVIIIDEIGTEAECIAARTIAQRGVQLVATAHGNELENVIKNPSLADLVGGIQSVTLGDEEARRRGVQKSVLERAAPPTFDVAVEMISRNKWKVHLDVAQSVDVLLAGGQPGGQVRERAADDSITKYSFNPQMPNVVFRPTEGAGGPAGGGRKKLGRREMEREQRLKAQREQGGQSAAEKYSSDGAASGRASSTGGSEASSDASGRSSPFVRSPVSLTGSGSESDDDEDFRAAVEDEDGGLSCRKAWKLHQRQASFGVTDDSDGGMMRLFPFDMDPDRLWEVMTAMDLVDKIYICYKVSDADAVLGLRPLVRAAASLRQAAKASGVPIYAIKNASTPSLVRALRTLVGIDPAAGAVFSRSSEHPAAALDPSPSSHDKAGVAARALRAELDIAVVDGRARQQQQLLRPRPTAAPQLPYKAFSEREALDEVEQAVEHIVLPLQQPVELLPRSEAVMAAQRKLIERYDLAHEVVGGDGEARLRILPVSMAAAAKLSPA